MEIVDPSEWLKEEPAVVSSFSDGLLVQWFQEGAVPDAEPALAAEMWLRHWLYKQSECPREIIAAIDSARAKGLVGFRPDFSRLFETHLLPLRQETGECKFPIVALADPTERLIWDLLCTRLRTFLEADGLIALVPRGPHNVSDAVAVPFQLEPGSRIVNAKDEFLVSWENDLEQFCQSYPLGMRLRTFCVFPKNGQPDGRSFGIALAIARERLSGRILWFHPLDVLVTGAVASRLLESVEGVPAKQALAKRIGCSIFFAPEAQQTEMSVAFSIGTPLDNALSVIRDRIPRSPILTGRVGDIVARCRKELQLWKALVSRPPINRLQEMERLLRSAGTRFTAGVPTSLEAGQAVNLLENLSASVNGNAFVNDLVEQETQVLQPYRDRVIYGRELFVTELNRFIHERSGGMRLVTGKSGYGKTALLAHWLASEPPGTARFIHFFRADRDALRSLSRFFSRLAKFLENLIPESNQLGAPQGELDQEAVRRLLRTYSYIPTHERPPLVVVLDGIDEASQAYFQSFFPFSRDSWPAGLHVVASARTPGGPHFPQIETWIQSATETPLDLTSLDHTALRSWLRASPAPLPVLADEPLFVDTLLQRAEGEGCALYIEHQLARLAKIPDIGTNWRREMNDTDMPEGYVKLIALQFKLAFENAEGASPQHLSLFKEMLELLTVARGPLDETDLRILLSTNLLPSFGELHRWIADSEGTSERGRLFRFNHQLIREALEKVGLPLQAARTKLLNYCLRWKEHGSPYALRHLVGHLKDAQPDSAVPDPHATLFEIGTDPEFLTAQARAFPDDIHVPLRTLQLALSLASEQNNIFQMAKLGLAHARRVSQISRESPLAALRAGHYHRATGLIAIYERREDRMLWHLLLAVDLMLHSNSAQCAFILQEVLPGEAAAAKFRPEHGGAALAMAFLILTRLDLPIPAGLVGLFHADDQQRLCRLLSQSGALQQAFTTWRAIQQPIQADHAGRCYLSGLAKAQGPAAALRLLDPIKDQYTRDFVRSDIAKISAKSGDISGARSVLSSMAPGHVLQQVELLCAIAESPAANNATSLLNEAWSSVDKLSTKPSDQALRATAIVRIAIAELAIGFPTHSAKNVEDAINLAATLPSVPQRAKCLSDLAQAFLDLPEHRGPIAKALDAILQALRRDLLRPDGDRRSPSNTNLSDEMLLRLAQQFSDAGDNKTAFTIARRIHSDKQSKYQAIASIFANSNRDGRPVPSSLAKHLHQSKSDRLHVHSQAVLERAVAGRLDGLLDEIAQDLIQFAPDKGAAHWGPARVLGAIGMAASFRNQHALAKDAFEGARRRISKLDHPRRQWHYAWALKNLAEDQAEAGDLDSARNIFEIARRAARKETRAKQKARLLSEIAGAEALALGKDAAQPAFKEALDFVCGNRWDCETDQVEALGQIIEDQSKSGLDQAANDTLDLAEAIVRSIDPTSNRVWLAQAQLALSLVKSAHFVPKFKAKAKCHADNARSSFRDHDHSKWERLGKTTHPPHGLVNRVYAVLATSDAQTEDDNPIKCLLRIRDVSTRSKGARDVAIAFMNSGNSDGFDAALSLVTNGRSELFPDIAQEFLAKKDKDGIKQFFLDSVFFLDCTHRMLALLLKLDKPDARTLNQIMSLITSGGMPLNHNPLQSPPTQSATNIDF